MVKHTRGTIHLGTEGQPRALHGCGPGIRGILKKIETRTPSREHEIKEFTVFVASKFQKNKQNFIRGKKF
jgi:hypothetical protein